MPGTHVQVESHTKTVYRYSNQLRTSFGWFVAFLSASQSSLLYLHGSVLVTSAPYFKCWAELKNNDPSCHHRLVLLNPHRPSRQRDSDETNPNWKTSGWHHLMNHFNLQRPIRLLDEDSMSLQRLLSSPISPRRRSDLRDNKPSLHKITGGCHHLMVQISLWISCCPLSEKSTKRRFSSHYLWNLPINPFNPPLQSQVLGEISKEVTMEVYHQRIQYGPRLAPLWLFSGPCRMLGRVLSQLDYVDC